MTTVHCEIKSDLGKKLQVYRADRPDEWTMDEFTREAEKMQVRNAEFEAALIYSIDIIKAISDDPEVLNVHKCHLDQSDTDYLTKALKDNS